MNTYLIITQITNQLSDDITEQERISHLAPIELVLLNLTEDVLQNGFIKVEMATSMEGPWFILPYVFYEGTTGDVGYIYDAWYSYGEGAVRVNWNCSFGRTPSDWEDISLLYEKYYKITTIVE